MGFLGTIRTLLGAVADNAGTLTRRFRMDPGGGNVVTTSQFGPAGSDFSPLQTDKAVMVQLPRSGGMAIVGYVDVKNSPVAGPGENRVYSRAPNGGVKATVWLYGDGKITLFNDAGFIELEAGGTVNINGVQINSSGRITAPGGVQGYGIKDLSTNVTLGTHKHPANNTAPTPGT